MRNGFEITEIFESLVMTVRSAVDNKDSDNCINWNQRSYGGSENGIGGRGRERGGGGDVMRCGGNNESGGFFSFMSCFTDCGSSQDPVGSNDISYSIPAADSPGAGGSRGGGGGGGGIGTAGTGSGMGHGREGGGLGAGSGSPYQQEMTSSESVSSFMRMPEFVSPAKDFHHLEKSRGLYDDRTGSSGADYGMYRSMDRKV